MVEELKRAGIKTLKDKEWKIEDGIVMKKERIRQAQKGDQKVVKAVEELKRAGIKTLKDKECKIEDELVMKEGRIYMPERELRRKVI